MIINVLLIAIIIVAVILGGLPFGSNVALGIGVTRWLITGDTAIVIVSIVLLMVMMGLIVFENLD